MNIVIITGASSGIGREFALQMDGHFNSIDEFWLVAGAGSGFRSSRRHWFTEPGSSRWISRKNPARRLWRRR